MKETILAGDWYKCFIFIMYERNFDPDLWLDYPPLHFERSHRAILVKSQDPRAHLLASYPMSSACFSG